MSDICPENFEAISVMRLEEGDKLVIKCERMLPAESCERIEKLVKGKFPGHECIVLHGGLSLEIARKVTA